MHIDKWKKFKQLLVLFSLLVSSLQVQEDFGTIKVRPTLFIRKQVSSRNSKVYPRFAGAWGQENYESMILPSLFRSLFRCFVLKFFVLKLIYTYYYMIILSLNFFKFYWFDSDVDLLFSPLQSNRDINYLTLFAKLKYKPTIILCDIYCVYFLCIGAVN